MDDQERLSLVYVKRIFHTLKTSHLDSAEAAAHARVFFEELRTILQKDAAGDPEARELLAEIQSWEKRNKPN
jgi:hypothetical protein